MKLHVNGKMAEDRLIEEKRRNMSKRPWTETHQVGAKNSTQK